MIIEELLNKAEDIAKLKLSIAQNRLELLTYHKGYMQGLISEGLELDESYIAEIQRIANDD